MTLNDLRPKIYSLCKLYGSAGIPTNDTVAEYDVNIPLWADIGQRELIEVGRLYKTYTYYKTTSTVNITVTNGATATKTITITLDGTIYNVNVTSGQTVTQVASAINSVIDALANYSSAVGGASSSVVTITPANTHQDDISISYDVNSSGVELVIGADKYVKITDITDLGTIVNIIDKTDGGFTRSPNFYVQNSKDIYVLNSFKGVSDINYRPAPTALTALTDTLTIDDNTAVQALTYYIAQMLLLEDNPSLSNFYEQKYIEQKDVLRRRDIAFEEPITDIYDTGGF